MTRGAGTSGRAVNKQSRKAAKPSGAPKTARRTTLTTSIDDPPEQISRLERDEALEQRAATAQVLRIISKFPGEPEPVFRAYPVAEIHGISSEGRRTQKSVGTFHAK